MKRFPWFARRVLSVAMATATGAAMLALVAPAAASAHTQTEELSIGHTTRCLPNGQREVTWTVTSSRDSDSTISVVQLHSAATETGFVDGNIIKVGATLPGAPSSLTDKQLMPGTNTSASLNVTTVFGSGEFTTPVSGSDEASFEACTPQYTVSQDCTGITFVFKAPPPGEAVISILITLHPSAGSDQSFTIKSGDSDKTVTIPGSPGLKVDLSYGENFKTTYTWTHDPCPSPTLPTTGSSLTGTVSAGIGLVVGGVALLVLLVGLRRRRKATES